MKTPTQKKSETHLTTSNSSSNSVKHRTVPLRETITHIGKGYPDKLVIFKSTASRFWWCRYYTGKRIVKKSTKTENKSEAVNFAKRFYEDILLRERNLLPIGQSSDFKRFADELLREQEELIRRGERNPLMNVNDRQKLNHDLLPNFGNFKITEITYKHINEFASKLSQRNLSTSSIKNHLNLLHKIFQVALREQVIKSIPSFPKIRSKDSPRGWFTEEEYEKLKNTISQLAKENTNVRGHVITKELSLLTTFMVNSFLRPSDLKDLRHRNIQIVEGRHKFLRIQTESSKTENTQVVTMDSAIGIYRDILDLQKKLKRPYGPDGFVFFPHLKGDKSKKNKNGEKINRNYAMQTIRRQFDVALEKSDLKKTPSGQARTLYSLRHTAIMFRLTLGDQIDSITLAKNARTSVQMLERFYAKHLQPEMNIDKLQSMRFSDSSKSKKLVTKQKN